jgi:hypothetical protein
VPGLTRQRGKPIQPLVDSGVSHVGFRCVSPPASMDPYERAEITSNSYWAWTLKKAFILFADQAIVAQFIATFKEFSPRQRPQSFTVDQIMEQLQRPTSD